MDIHSYKSVDKLLFNASREDDCIKLYGEPLNRRKNRYGNIELQYSGFHVRFDMISLCFFECTLLHNKDASINNIQVTWDDFFLRRLCKEDGSQVMAYGFVVFPKLGLAVSGLHEEDQADPSITVFAEQILSIFMVDSIPFYL